MQGTKLDQQHKPNYINKLKKKNWKEMYQNDNSARFWVSFSSFCIYSFQILI